MTSFGCRTESLPPAPGDRLGTAWGQGMPGLAERLRRHVARLEGERHPLSSPEALAAAEDYAATVLAASGLEVELHDFRHRGVVHHNVVGRRPGTDPDRPAALVGAHLDTVAGSPGADDNASGVAVLLEAARLLAEDDPPLAADVELVAFNLEEPQGPTYRVGSRRFAAEARRRGDEYAGCLVLEMVGYTDPEPGSQEVPALLFWKRVPEAGTFLAATGDSGSRELLRTFRRCTAEAAPDLELVTLQAPARGWAVPITRLSDNASFWDEGYPALMVTDTSFLRNPHYHRASDRLETLDFSFMEQVTRAVVATARALAG